MSMRPGEIRVPPGAVDLSALKARAQQPPPPAGGGSADAGPWVVDVVDATFERDVLLRSRDVPVVIDFWAEWCGPCKQLSPVLERLAAEAQGAWILAKIDTEASPRLAQAFQVQSIPAVFAVIAEQPVPLFQGALPEAQVRQVLEQVVAAARQQGLPGGGEAPAEAAALDPAYDEAEQALARGEVDAARTAYQDLVARNPADALARTALTRIDLIARARGYDQQAVRRKAADAPDDVEAQCAVADLDLLTGNIDDAFGRLIDTVRRTSGADRERARAHLLSLFGVLDPDDPRLATARRDLANALF